MASDNLFGSEAAPPARQKRGVQTVHAHCDGGARGNPGPSGYGAVLVDADGRTLAQLSEFLGIRTNNYAEYSGLLGVLQWTIENGYRSVRVVSDSELMVKQIQGRYKVNSPDLRPLFEEAKRRIAKLDSFQIAHALRHKNKDADRLANDAMDRGMGRPKPLDEQRAVPYPNSSPAAKVASREPVLEVKRKEAFLPRLPHRACCGASSKTAPFTCSVARACRRDASSR